MIGKISDLVSAAVVINAANSATSLNSDAGAVSEGSDLTTTSSEAGGAVTKSNNAENVTTGAGNTDNTAQLNQDSKKDDNDDKLDEKSVDFLTKELNDLMDKINCDLQFQYHKEVDVMSVKMINKETKDVIKEFPPEEMVEGMIKAREWLGTFIDKKA